MMAIDASEPHDRLTRAAALEYAKEGIRVNAVYPGVIWTAMVL